MVGLRKEDLADALKRLCLLGEVSLYVNNYRAWFKTVSAAVEVVSATVDRTLVAGQLERETSALILTLWLIVLQK